MNLAQVSLSRAELELIRDLVERWLVELYESQRVALEPDMPVPHDVLDGLEEKVVVAEQLRDWLRSVA